MACTSPPHVDRLRARAGIAAIDAVLEVLEQRRLPAARTASGMPPRWRQVLETSGLTIPDGVIGATTAVQLHERLLDWQERLLRAAYPRRAAGAREGRRRDTHRWLVASRRPAPRGTRPMAERRVEGRPAVATAPEAPAPPPVSAAEDGLTDREIAVLRIVAEGLTNAQVAGRLQLSEHTVAAHLRSIFRKAGVSSRAAATRYAIERGVT